MKDILLELGKIAILTMKMNRREILIMAYAYKEDWHKMNYSHLDFKYKIDNIFEVYMNKSAIVCMDSQKIIKKICYSEIASVIENLRIVLKQEGLKKGDKIAIIAPHMGATVVLNLALAYLGYINVLIDSALHISEQKRLLELTDVKAIFTTCDLYENFMDYDVGIFEIREEFIYRKIKNAITKTENSKEKLSEDVIAILFSSGTTGTMKGIEISYNSILRAWEYMLQYTNLNSKVSFLNVLPSNHIAGYSAAMSCLLAGAEMGFVSKVDAYNLSRAFLIYNPTNFIMIPKVYEVIKDKIVEALRKKSWIVRLYANAAMAISGFVRKRTGLKFRLLTKPIWKAALGRNMRVCGCGTAPCSEDITEFYLNLGLDFVNVYGATETGFPICAANYTSKYPNKGVGNAEQFQDISIKIVNPDEKGVGEVRVKTPLIMLGYYKDAQLTQTAFDENEYFRTGDCGYIDSGGNLHITGRIKENIMLQNGKKVSPIDIDNFVAQFSKNIKIASCGVDSGKGYDEIHLFIETMGNTRAEIDEATKNIRSISTSIYKISKIHYVETIPITSVGKVKRFLLKDYAKASQDSQATNVEEFVNDLSENRILAMISKISKVQVSDVNLKLKKDLDMDSLELFELCVAIDEQYHVSIEPYMNDEISALDILELIESKCEKCEKKSNLEIYPIKRTKMDYRNIKRFIRFSHFFWDFKVLGVENINADEQYIFCPNHESHFDGMWIVGHLDDKFINSICSMAADYLFHKKIFRKGVTVMGAIPVDRGGNTTTAMKRAYECVSKEGYSLLIHPEGTRTRNGELGEFKSGAAKLAIETGIKVVPVCINGAYEIFPTHRKIPRLFNWRQLCKYKMQIQYGIPITPDDKTEKELTEEIRQQIVEFKYKLRERKIL